MVYDYKSKTRNVNNMISYMFAKTLSMFEYQGLPETIPQRELERLLQTNGYAFITEVNGELYAMAGSLAGTEKDPYGQPTEITINNVALNFNKTLNLKTDGVLIRNDDVRIGLLPLFEKGSTLLAENDVNMVMWGINSRIQKLISAPDDKSRESAELYIKKIIDGDLSIIADNALFDGVKMQAPAASSVAGVQQMIEYHQFVKSNLYNEIGLSSNFNMKRERLISSEVDQAEDSLFPFVYNMMENRNFGIAAINEMFGLNIKVDFGSVWALKNKKLVDGVTGNNGIPDSGVDHADNGNPNESTGGGDHDGGGERDGSGEQDGGWEQENTVINQQTENGNDNGEPAQGPDTVADLQAVIDNPESSEADKQAAQELLNEITGEV